MPILTEEERLGTLVAGRYRLESILGRGGSGVVFEALHTWTGRRVAVKLLRPEYARDMTLVRRLLQEARAAAGIEHPNVVQVLDMGADQDGSVYLVLELLRGESLSQVLEREPKLAPEDSLAVTLPILDALSHAHEQGIIHRDLKPDNVFLRRDANGRRVPTLLDFGMARMQETAWGHATQSGTLIGTPFYMSPEQAEGEKELGPPTDVWSVGVILYRCLTGKLPFAASTPTKLLMVIVNGRPEPVTSVAPDVPPALGHAVDRAIVADLDERYPDVPSLAAGLRDAAERSGIALDRVTLPAPGDVDDRSEEAVPVEGEPSGPSDGHDRSVEQAPAGAPGAGDVRRTPARHRRRRRAALWGSFAVAVATGVFVVLHLYAGGSAAGRRPGESAEEPRGSDPSVAATSEQPTGADGDREAATASGAGAQSGVAAGPSAGKPSTDGMDAPDGAASEGRGRKTREAPAGNRAARLASANGGPVRSGQTDAPDDSGGAARRQRSAQDGTRGESHTETTTAVDNGAAQDPSPAPTEPPDEGNASGDTEREDEGGSGSIPNIAREW